MQKKVRTVEKISYTSSLLGQNMIYNFMAMYVMFFFTDLLKIAPGAVTTIVVIASLWDAVNDPMMGLIADRTRTRWGKFRPYLIFGPFVIFLTTVLCYVSFDADPTVVAVLSTFFYIFWGMSYTVCDIPIWAISSTSSDNPDERNTMVSLGKIGGTIGTVIISVFSMNLITALGGERDRSAYLVSAIIVAGVGAALMLLSGFFLRERVQDRDQGRLGLKDDLKTITTNRPMLLLMVALLLVNTVNNIRQVAQVYFVLYVWGNPSYVTYVGLSLVIGMLLGLAITPALIRRLEKKKIFMYSCMLGFAFSLPPFLVFRENAIFGLVMLGFSFFFTGVTTIVSSSMLMDVIDYSEYRLGFRGEGLVFSMNTFLNKLSATISKGILGLMMIAISYTENMDPSPEVQTAFSSLMYLVPALAFMFTIIPLYFYDLSDEKMNGIREKMRG